MNKPRPEFEESAIIAALLRLEDGDCPAQLCLELGITIKTLDGWQKAHAEELREARAIADSETDFLVARVLKAQPDSAGQGDGRPAEPGNPKSPNTK